MLVVETSPGLSQMDYFAIKSFISITRKTICNNDIK